MKPTAELKVLPVSVLKPAAYNPRKKLKSSRTAVCQNCGREFAAYCESGGKRKFCSRNCYYESRYGLKEEG